MALTQYLINYLSIINPSGYTLDINQGCPQLQVIVRRDFAIYSALMCYLLFPNDKIKKLLKGVK